MNLDDLRTQWAAQGAQLERNVRMDFRQIIAGTQRVSSALRRLSRGIVAELLLGVVAVLLLGSFIADHIDQPRFLVPALLLHSFVIVQVGFGIYQLLALRSIDLSAPIVESQRALRRLRLLSTRVTLATLLIAPLLWVPLLIVMLKGLLGIDAYAAFETRWLVANVAFGVAIIPLGVGLARRYAGRIQGSPLLQRVLDSLAGHSLNAALASLDELERFEQER